MDMFQIATLALLSMFYLAYIVKSLLLKRRGISVNQLGKGDKPESALTIERLLRAVTLAGAAVQFGSALFPNTIWTMPVPVAVQLFGVSLLIVGVLFFVLALLAMRDNWRAGFDSNQNTALVTGGIYRISRNPAFLGFDLLYVGCSLIFPNIIHVITALSAVVLFHCQILAEETYCAAAFGDAYLAYKSKTMRYIGFRK